MNAAVFSNALHVIVNRQPHRQHLQNTKCETVSFKFQLRDNERTDGQMERRQESNLVFLALKCDIWWQYFPDNQLSKFRVYWLIPDF